MISTVTTSTVTTVVTIAAMGLTGVISIAAVVSLALFLTTKELVSVGTSKSARFTARFLNIGILPLIMAFVVMVVVKIAEILA